MIIELQTKNYNAPERFKEVLNKKLEKLDKFFDTNTKVKVLCKQSNDVHTLELTILVGSTVLRSEVSSGQMYDNIDLALPKLEKQIIKFNSKYASKIKRDRVKIADIAAPVDNMPHTIATEKIGKVVKTKSYKLDAKTTDEAIDELEMVGHSFYVYKNANTKKVNIIYRRNDGDYGIIEAI